MSRRISDERLREIGADGTQDFETYDLANDLSFERALSARLAEALRAAKENIEGLNEYLNDICDAYEAWEKATKNGPGSGINDPGPSNEECEAHDEECGARWNDITEAIETACGARDPHDDDAGEGARATLAAYEARAKEGAG